MSAAPAATALLLMAAMAAAQDRICTVRTIDGRALRGPVTASEATATVGDVEIPLDEITVIDQSGFVSPRRPRLTHRVRLRSGEVLAVESIEGAAIGPEGSAQLRLELVDAEEAVEMPMRHVAAIRMQRGDGLTAPTFDRDVERPGATLDYIYVENEGVVRRFSVTMEKIEGGKVHFDLNGRPIEFALDGVVAVVFGVNTGFPPDPQPLPRATLATRTGGNIGGRLLELTRDDVTLRMDEGPEITLPRQVVSRIDIVSDKLVYLSDLEPVIEQTPALDRVWPIYTDRAPGGEAIFLGGTRYDRGLVVVPHTRLTYRTGGRYDYLETTIGIEDRAGPQAHAVFRVYADGERIFESDPMTRGSEPEVLRLPIGAAESITLEADFGMNLDLGDHCVFAEARIVQS